MGETGHHLNSESVREFNILDRLLAQRALAACARRAYTGAMRRAWKKIRYRLEWLGLKAATKFLPLLSRKACYRLALLLGSLGAMLDRRGPASPSVKMT